MSEIKRTLLTTKGWSRNVMTNAWKAGGKLPPSNAIGSRMRANRKEKKNSKLPGCKINGAENEAATAGRWEIHHETLQRQA